MDQLRPPDGGSGARDGRGRAPASGPGTASRWRWRIIPLLALNWFGDSLDGTLARVRHRSGHAMATTSTTSWMRWGSRPLIGGLVLGRVHVDWPSAWDSLRAYYLLVVEVALAAHAGGRSELPSGVSAPPSCASCSGCWRHAAAAIAGRHAVRVAMAAVRRRRALAIAGSAVTFTVVGNRQQRGALSRGATRGRANMIPYDNSRGGRRPSFQLEDPRDGETGRRRHPVRSDARRNPRAGTSIQPALAIFDLNSSEDGSGRHDRRAEGRSALTRSARSGSPRTSTSI